MWPAIAYVVPEEKLGMAYGVVTAVQNLGLALIPIATGAIITDNPSQETFHEVELFFCVVGIVGVALGIWLNVVDTMGDGVLNKCHLKDAEDSAAEPIV